MAKNKLRGQKSRNVFHIASQRSLKVKNKAKPVTTNLKKVSVTEALCLCCLQKQDDFKYLF